MEHSLEGLAKERGARYLKFNFTGAKRIKSETIKHPEMVQSERKHQEFREEANEWSGPRVKQTLDRPASFSQTPKGIGSFATVTSTSFSFFAASLFLCFALFVLHILPANALFEVKTLGHVATDRVEFNASRISEVSLLLVVFGITSTLAFGYSLSWITRVIVRICGRLFGKRPS